MTEPNFSLATTQFFLNCNEEDLENYCQQNNDCIASARDNIKFLIYYFQNPKKQKLPNQTWLLWNSLQSICKILGYQNQFNKIKGVDIPEEILAQQLISCGQMFKIKQHQSGDNIDCDEDNKFYVMLEGYIEKDNLRASRASIFKLRRESTKKVGNKNQTFVIKRKHQNSNKRRIILFEKSMPSCLNPKIQYETIYGKYKINRNSIFLEVDQFKWQYFINQFKKIYTNHFLSFIRKNIGINLNLKKIQQCEEQQQKEPTQSNVDKKKRKKYLDIQKFKQNLINLERIQKKKVISLDEQYLYLVYQGQIEVRNNIYRIQTNKGSIINSSIIYKMLNKPQQITFQEAYSKKQSSLLKVDLKVLKEYFEVYLDDQHLLQQLLISLQKKRCEKKMITPIFKKEDKRKTIQRKIEKNKTVIDKINKFMDEQTDKEKVKEIGLMREKGEVQTKRMMIDQNNESKVTHLRNFIFDQRYAFSQTQAQRKIKKEKKSQIESQNLAKNFDEKLVLKQMENNVDTYKGLQLQNQYRNSERDMNEQVKEKSFKNQFFCLEKRYLKVLQQKKDVSQDSYSQPNKSKSYLDILLSKLKGMKTYNSQEDEKYDSFFPTEVLNKTSKENFTISKKGKEVMKKVKSGQIRKIRLR